MSVMTKKPCDFDRETTLLETSNTFNLHAHRRLGAYFHAHRLALGVSEMSVVHALDLCSLETLIRYEAGRAVIPLEDVYALTNLLNLAPEDVMDLIYEISATGTR